MKPSFNTPWIIWNELRRLLVYPWIRFRFLLAGVPWGRKWRILGTPIIQRHRGSRIDIGDNLIMRSWITSNPIAPSHPVFFSTRAESAIIKIGDDFGITGGSIVAADRIDIGNRVMIGGNCIITDTDFHPLDKEIRIKTPQKSPGNPIKISDDVFIGMNVTILKGSTIGQGSIIGAGSVISGEIPSNVVVAGNPAKIIRNLEIA
jgi:acetyltransferase-like isoleucine patch superfamily enzyme